MHLSATFRLLALAAMWLMAASMSFEDDDKLWNALFSKSSEPDLPLPGAFANGEWNRFVFGFPPRLWDSHYFQSLVDVPVKQKGSNTTYEAWGHMWTVMEYHMTMNLRKRLSQASIMELWIAYMSSLKRIFCCQDKYMMLQNFFTCTNSLVNDCCKSAELKGTCSDHKGRDIVKGWARKSIQGLQFRFYVWYCLVHLTKHSLEDLHDVCPNPCKEEPCKAVLNSRAGSRCRQTPGAMGRYRGEFSCSCRDDYRFDHHSKKCEPRSRCALNPCSSVGYLRCIDTEYSFRCHCRPGFVGDTCASIMDACRQRENSSDVSGHLACRVADGNNCTAVHAFDSFTCTCRHPYTRETDLPRLRARYKGRNLPPDNCDGSSDPCSRLHCNSAAEAANDSQPSGWCLPAADGTGASCLCRKDDNGYPLFEGAYCQTPVSRWLAWGAWGECRPECGDSCFRARLRRCGHEFGRRHCRGDDEQLADCPDGCRPCPNLTVAQAAGVYFYETEAWMPLAAASALSLYLLLVACAAFCVRLCCLQHSGARAFRDPLAHSLTQSLTQ